MENITESVNLMRNRRVASYSMYKWLKYRPVLDYVELAVHYEKRFTGLVVRFVAKRDEIPV